MSHSALVHGADSGFQIESTATDRFIGVCECGWTSEETDTARAAIVAVRVHQDPVGEAKRRRRDAIRAAYANVVAGPRIQVTEEISVPRSLWSTVSPRDAARR